MELDSMSVSSGTEIFKGKSPEQCLPDDGLHWAIVIAELLPSVKIAAIRIASLV